MITKLISYFKSKHEFSKFIHIWKLANRHNSINPLHIFPNEIVKVGKGSYGDLSLMFWNPENERLTIGNYVSIASDVTFILGGNHHTDTLMTYPSCRLSAGGQRSFSKGEIMIEDDVWIGFGCMILSGVTIGKGAVIGAGSVVAKNIPPYAIAVGNPIQIVKYRFNPDVIEKLLKLDYNFLDEQKAKININWLNQPINSQTNLENLNSLFLAPIE